MSAAQLFGHAKGLLIFSCPWDLGNWSTVQGPETAMVLSEGALLEAAQQWQRCARALVAAPAGASARDTGGSWSLTQSPAGRMERSGTAGDSCGPSAGPSPQFC